MLETIKAAGKDFLPAPLWRWLSLARWRGPRILANPQDLLACAAFIANPAVHSPLKQRWHIVRQMYGITLSIPSPHTDAEMIRYIKTILCLPPGSSRLVAEAGYKGISTAKFSLAAAAAGRQLVVFDSFEGIPANDEPHRKTIFGGPAHFAQGDYAWGLEGVKAHIARYGHLERCRFVEGWFDDTLPSFNEPLAAIYLDVDLAASTRTCIKYLYPLLEPGGVMFSQDGHLPLVIDVLDDDNFWQQEVGCAKPRMFGLGKKKLVKIVKAPTV
jgi:O-methyltransferase